MSYILDALRRAEAERSRGAVPGIHTQVIPAGAVLATPRRAVAPVAIVAFMAVLGVAVAAGLWWATRSGAGPQAKAASLSMPVGAPAVVAARADALPVPVSIAQSPEPPLAVSSVRPAAPVVAVAVPDTPPRSPRTAPVLGAEQASISAPGRSQAPGTAGVSGAIAAPPAQRPAKPSAASALVAGGQTTGSIFVPADLPDAVRAQLPTLRISGITYSSDPVARMAIVNGQVLHEGDAAAPGLLLEKIEAMRTVWAFQGYRVALAP